MAVESISSNAKALTAPKNNQETNQSDGNAAKLKESAAEAEQRRAALEQKPQKNELAQA